MVIIGGLQEDANAILDRATTYLGKTSGKPYAYPWYDSYTTDADSCHLADGDLLAPLLLNAAPSITAYRTLRGWRERLEGALCRLSDLTEARASPSTHLDCPDTDPLIGELYQVIDNEPGGGISGATLSKVLHRKQPAVIPLFDSKILYAYRDHPNAPIEHSRRRIWVEFMTQLSTSIREDMRRPEAEKLVRSVQGQAQSGSPITALRAWDIVVWQTVAAHGPANPPP